MNVRPFHLALPVNDLEAARQFYTTKVGCSIGRESERWIDFNFFGHQVTVHLAELDGKPKENPVDGDKVPSRHFGVIMEMADWKALSERLVAEGTDFLIAPKIRFQGEPGEQATMFFFDPAGNALEFKAFANDAMIFET
ncbi:MAG: VOC family protein [Candidatus Sumerlaeia bacterium]|nr:VOC family protein [Candidatus Sumerlaeia bacterium]